MIPTSRTEPVEIFQPVPALRQADLDYFRHMTTFTDAEISMQKQFFFI
jgi:hypothetical protein